MVVSLEQFYVSVCKYVYVIVYALYGHTCVCVSVFMYARHQVNTCNIWTEYVVQLLTVVWLVVLAMHGIEERCYLQQQAYDLKIGNFFVLED